MKKIIVLIIVLISFNTINAQSSKMDPILSMDWTRVPTFTPIVIKGTGAPAQYRTGIIAPGGPNKVHQINFKVKLGVDNNGAPVYGVDNSMAVFYTGNVQFDRPTVVTVLCWANEGDLLPIIWGN